MAQIPKLPRKLGFELISTICLTLLDLLSLSLWSITESPNDTIILNGPHADENRLFTLPGENKTHQIKLNERLHRAYHAQWGVKLIIGIINMISDKPLSYPSALSKKLTPAYKQIPNISSASFESTCLLNVTQDPKESSESLRPDLPRFLYFIFLFLDSHVQYYAIILFSSILLIMM